MIRLLFRLIPVLQVAACICFGVGLSLWFVHDEPAAAAWLLGIALVLWNAGETRRTRRPRRAR